MSVHKLKTWPVQFEEIAQERKLFEYRRDDRREKYQRNDILLLEEYIPSSGKYTGRKIVVEVTYIMRHDDAAGFNAASGVKPPLNLPKGWVIMGFKIVDNAYSDMR